MQNSLEENIFRITILIWIVWEIWISKGKLTIRWVVTRISISKVATNKLEESHRRIEWITTTTTTDSSNMTINHSSSISLINTTIINPTTIIRIITQRTNINNGIAIITITKQAQHSLTNSNNNNMAMLITTILWMLMLHSNWK